MVKVLVSTVEESEESVSCHYNEIGFQQLNVIGGQSLGRLLLGDFRLQFGEKRSIIDNRDVTGNSLM